MIATLTWNPSLDYVVTVHGFRQGRTNRTEEEQIFPGGKGINVSLVLKQLGVESIPLGFAAGFTGEEIVRLTRKQGLSPEFITVPGGYSRINVKWKTRMERSSTAWDRSSVKCRSCSFMKNWTG